MRRKISDNQKDIEEIRKQNFILDQQSRSHIISFWTYLWFCVYYPVRALESPNGDSLAEFLSDEELESEEAEDDLDQPDFSRRNKKMKTFHA